MHLVIVTPSWREPDEAAQLGGVARSSERIVESLRGAGHTVDVCAPSTALFAGESRLDTRPDGHLALRVGAVPGDETATLQHWCDAVRRLLRQRPIELALGLYGTRGGFVAAVAAARERRASVVALRGNDLDRELFDGARLAHLRLALERATAVTTVSRSMAGAVTTLFGREAHFVTNGVDTVRFAPRAAEAVGAMRATLGLEAGRPVIGLFGELKPKRGLDRLVRLTERLSTAWQLVIVGRVRPEVRHLVPPGARVAPPLDEVDALCAAYGVCDVVLQPSHHDGMPNVVLEAMACERTVVASAVGGLPDLIEHGVSGLLVDRDAPDEAWVSTLESLRDSPRPRLGRTARAQVPSPADECAALQRVLDAATSGVARDR